MALNVPSLTFSRTEKGEEFLPKDQVTRLIDDLQRAHLAAVKEALSPVQAEVTRLESAHKEADKKAARAADLERELGDVRGRMERRDVAAELLGLTDPGEIEDLHSLYSSRTAGLEADKRPAFRAWAEGHLANPAEAPALVRGIFEAAAGRQQGGERQPQQPAPQAPAAPRQQVQTGGGRVAAPPSRGKMTVDSVQQAFQAGASAKDVIRQWRQEQGYPVAPEPKVDSGNGKG